MPELEETKETADEFDKEFDKATEGEPKEEVEGKPEEGAEAEDKKPEEKKPKEKVEEKKKEDEPDFKAEAEKYKLEAKTNKQFADDMAKKLADKEVKDSEAKEKADKEALETVPEDIQAYLEENPGTDKVIDFFAKRETRKAMDALNTELTEATGGVNPVTFIIQLRDAFGKVEFERDLLFGYYGDDGKYVKGHPDGLEIVRTQRFNDWFREEVKKDNTLIEKQNDAKESIKILNTYKQILLSEAGQKEKKKLDKTKDEVEESMHATVVEGVQKGKGKGPDKDDFDGAFDEATKT